MAVEPENLLQGDPMVFLKAKEKGLTGGRLLYARYLAQIKGIEPGGEGGLTITEAINMAESSLGGPNPLIAQISYHQDQLKSYFPSPEHADYLEHLYNKGLVSELVTNTQEVIAATAWAVKSHGLALLKNYNSSLPDSSSRDLLTNSISGINGHSKGLVDGISLGRTYGETFSDIADPDLIVCIPTLQLDDSADDPTIVTSNLKFSARAIRDFAHKLGFITNPGDLNSAYCERLLKAPIESDTNKLKWFQGRVVPLDQKYTHVGMSIYLQEVGKSGIWPVGFGLDLLRRD